LIGLYDAFRTNTRPGVDLRCSGRPALGSATGGPGSKSPGSVV
jgi:hypothetical protein